MDTDERLERLEQRLATLEGLVRRLLVEGQRVRGEEGPRDRGPEGQRVERPVIPSPVAATSASVQPPAPPPIRPAAPRTVDSEQWFGQRGLLAVGVVFLILAAGYLLKLSFERGWISPAARCVGGALAGLGVGAIGYRLHSKGLATYGAALVGCGAAIVYLAVWAASRLYQFLPPTSGIVALALVSLSLAAIAFLINVEALGATAALGAFFAPILLGSPDTHANLLLLYLGCMGGCLGWVAARRAWRMAMVIVAASFFGLVIAGPYAYANPHGLLLYGLLGGSAGLYVGLREGWWETRLLSFSGGWTLLGYANDNLADRWLTLAGAAVLAAPVWWRALQADRIWPREARDPVELSPGESFYFYITPLLLAWAVYQVAPGTFDRNEGLLALSVAVPYLIAGYSGRRTRFALVGTTAVLAAILLQWDGILAPWMLLGAAVLWTGVDHLLQRSDGRWFGLLAVATALGHLLYVDLHARSSAEPAFVGPYPVALLGTIVVLALIGLGFWRRIPGDERTIAANIPSLAWGTAGLILLLGVTAELRRYFQQSEMERDTAALASGLSVSAWWIVFAAGLVLLGFRRNLKPVRVAGLVVSAMAIIKVVLFDLSTLDALYRVGSVLILGVVSLGLAYLYNKRNQSPEQG
jgi:Predicted membrane protein (DUF2339)